MVAGHVVPLDPVSVEVVEDGEAGLGAGRLLPGRPVVRLGQTGAARTHNKCWSSIYPTVDYFLESLFCKKKGSGLGCWLGLEIVIPYLSKFFLYYY